MSRFVINNKVYDTEKMEHIGIVKKWYKLSGYLEKQIFGENAGRMRECELYKSAKGNFFVGVRREL